MTKESLLRNTAFAVLFLVAAAAFSVLMRSEKLSLPSALAQGGGATGEIIALHVSPDTLVIVDTQKRKMLTYRTGQASRGLGLLEVRSFEDALKLPDYFCPNTQGLSGKDEGKAVRDFLEKQEKEKK